MKAWYNSVFVWWTGMFAMTSLVSYLIHQALLLILQKKHIAPFTRYVALLDLDCLYAQSKDIWIFLLTIMSFQTHITIKKLGSEASFAFISSFFPLMQWVVTEVVSL